MAFKGTLVRSFDAAVECPIDVPIFPPDIKSVDFIVSICNPVKIAILPSVVDPDFNAEQAAIVILAAF